MAGVPGVSSLSPAGSIGSAGGLALPSGGINLAALMPLALSAPLSSSAAANGKQMASSVYGPFNVSPQMVQTYGIGSPFNPMTALDLMNAGVGGFMSPLGGSGLPGYPPTSFGANLTSSAAGPMRGSQMGAGAAPVPQSGGKGIVG
jgi:hypothetical protein